MLRSIARRVPRSHSGASHAESSQERDNYRNLVINGAWFGPVDGGIFNFLPVFLARLGASPSMIGLVTSGPSLVGILSYLPAGAFAERQRDLVRLTVVTGIAGRIGYLLIALLPFLMAQEHLPLAAVIIWSLISVPNAVTVTTWMAVVQKAVSPAHRARLNGVRWSVLSIVSAFCILAFGFLLDRLPFPSGYQVVFLVSFLAGIVNMYYFARVRIDPFVRETRAVVPRQSMRARLAASLRPFAASPAFVRFNIASFVYRLALNTPIALYSIYWVNDLHASDTWIGLRGMAAYAALVVGYRFWGGVANRLGHRRLLVVSGVMLAFYPIATALVPSVSWLLPAAMLWGLSISGIEIGLFDMLLATCPPGREPSFAAASNMVISLATATGPWLGAALAGGFDTRTALLLSGGMLFTATLFFRLLPSREQEALETVA